MRYKRRDSTNKDNKKPNRNSSSKTAQRSVGLLLSYGKLNSKTLKLATGFLPLFSPKAIAAMTQLTRATAQSKLTPESLITGKQVLG